MKNKILLELKKNFPKLKNNNYNIATSKLKNIEGWDSLSSINFILKIEPIMNYAKFDRKLFQGRNLSSLWHEPNLKIRDQRHKEVN